MPYHCVALTKRLIKALRASGRGAEVADHLADVERVAVAAEKVGIKGGGELKAIAEELGESVLGAETLVNVLDSAKNIRSNLSNVSEAIPGTTIPKYFNIEAGGQAFHVNPNATKHMGEYVNSLPTSHGFMLRNDLTLATFEGAVKEAVTSGAWKTSLETGKPIISVGWELIFSQRQGDTLPVIIHALMKK